MTAEASRTGSPTDLAADGGRPLDIALLTYKGNPFCGGQASTYAISRANWPASVTGSR